MDYLRLRPVNKMDKIPKINFKTKFVNVASLI